MNQRTSGPVNAHLTPGLYLNAVIHAYSPSAKTDNPLCTKFRCQQKLQVLKRYTNTFFKFDIVVK